MHINIKGFKQIVATLPLCLLAACSSSPEKRTVEPNEIFVQSKLDPSHELNYRKPVAPPSLSLQQRMPKAKTGDQVPSWISAKKYRFRANRIQIREALSMFAKTYNLNIYYEPEITGEITVDFKGLSLDKAMEVILGSHGYYWQWQDNLIHVGKYQTKSYVIDYIRLTRSGSGSSSASIAMGGGQAGGETSASITQGDNISFWGELEAQLKNLIGENGRLTINKTTGTIQVTDSTDRIMEIERFITDVKKSSTRQVMIEARIIEVQLSDDNQLGVDWGEINILNFTGLTDTISSLTSKSLNVKTATAQLSYNDGRFKGVIQALSEQGNIKVMSQPRIRTLNNQPAIIKVGTDGTFFATQATSTTGAGATQVVTSETATTVTEGIVLSVTPQISSDGQIMIDVSPVITRIADVITSQFGSTAPVLDIKQTSTLVRARSGEMIVVGGLIQDVKIKRTRKVPFLGSIPLLGRIFSSRSDSTQRSELVVFLVPKIIG